MTIAYMSLKPSANSIAEREGIPVSFHYQYHRPDSRVLLYRLVGPGKASETVHRHVIDPKDQVPDLSANGADKIATCDQEAPAIDPIVGDGLPDFQAYSVFRRKDFPTLPILIHFEGPTDLMEECQVSASHQSPRWLTIRKDGHANRPG